MKQHLFWFLFFCGGTWKQLVKSQRWYKYKKSYLIDGNIAMDPQDQDAEDFEDLEYVAHRNPKLHSSSRYYSPCSANRSLTEKWRTGSLFTKAHISCTNLYKHLLWKLTKKKKKSVRQIFQKGCYWSYSFKIKGHFGFIWMPRKSCRQFDIAKEYTLYNSI